MFWVFILYVDKERKSDLKKLKIVERNTKDFSNIHFNNTGQMEKVLAKKLILPHVIQEFKN